MKKENRLMTKNHDEEIKRIASENTRKNLQRLSCENFSELKDAREKLKSKYGVNKPTLQRFNFFKKFFGTFIEPFNLLLLAIGVANLLLYIFLGKKTEELVGFCLVIFMVLLAAVTDFYQDYKSYKINISLHNLVVNKYSRIELESDDINFDKLYPLLENRKTLNEDEITVGDVLYFSKGDVIPADCKIIWSEGMTVDQAQLTGESDAVEKTFEWNAANSILDLTNILYSQSVVVTGSCVAIVIKIADETYSGRIAKFTNEEEIKTDFNKGISKVTKLILLITFLAFIVVMVASSLRTNSWSNGAILGITIVVVLTPEALPAILSGNLQLGSKLLSKQKVVVKNFDIIQNMGSLNILATDKTGTLTSEKVKVIEIYDENKLPNVEAEKYFYLNAKYHSTATNQIDLALVDFLKNKNYDSESNKFIFEKSFDFEKRTISVVVKVDGVLVQITKGSAQEMLSILKYKKQNGRNVALSEDEKFAIKKIVEENSKNGYRSIILGTKILTSKEEFLEDDLLMQGIAVLHDELKEGVPEAIASIQNQNVEIKVMSGDAKEVVQNISRRIGINHAEQSINGYELDIHNHKLIEETSSFSKLTPMQKGQIINCLHEEKKVVGFIGDGVNDVLALKVSDVGISVNNGSSSAKQAADIILLEKDLFVISNALMLGRKIFSNALKFIKLTVAANFGLMLSMLITSIWFSFQSMAPIQLLIQNVLFDVANLFFVFDKVDDFSIKKPMRWNTKTFIPFVIFVGAIATLISMINLVIMGLGFNMLNADGSSNNISEMQTIFFIETFISHMIVIIYGRTEKVSIIQSHSSWPMYAGMTSLFGVLLIFVYTPYLNNLFDLTPPRKIWWAIEAGLCVLMWGVFEVGKLGYKKIFKVWI